ncbi:MAG: hypothetical protein IPO58_24750 [Betaproteobacteria bacterium]|nr:hypothetical protein [Betaproteobacteria bacterium]
MLPTFRRMEHGVFCAHHYAIPRAPSTFLVEVNEATWRRAGFAGMSEADTIRHCQRVFAKPTSRGPPILSN